VATISHWKIEADYIESCNCDFGCPCNFSGFPTGGRCEALVGYHIRSGSYGSLQLDGLDFVYAASWPRAIHEGGGMLRVYIDERASAEQRAALTEITYGRAGGNGCFPVFSSTMRYSLDPQFVPVRIRVDGKRSNFSVPGVLEVQLAPHVDPVSGNEQDVQVSLPKGFIWQLANAVKTAAMRITTPNLNFDHRGQNAFWTTVEFHGP
jgi:hypothetical protein